MKNLPAHHFLLVFIGLLGYWLIGLFSPFPVHAQAPTTAPMIFGTDASGNFFIRAKVGAGTPTPFPVFSMDQNGNQQTSGTYGGFSSSTVVNQAQYSSFDSTCTGASTTISSTNCWYGTGGTFTAETSLYKHGTQSFKAALGGAGSEIFGPYIASLSNGTSYIITLLIRSSNNITPANLTWKVTNAADSTTYCASAGFPISLAADTWIKVTMGCTSGATGTDGILKITNSLINTNIYVDQVQVESCSSATTCSSSPYVPNFGTGSLSRGPGLTAPGDFFSYGNTYLASSYGSVGIGTTIPARLLHLYSAGAGSSAALRLDEAAPRYEWRESDQASGSKNWDLIADGATMTLRTLDDNFANPSSLVTFLRGGNVGIGTTVPGQKLSVAGVVESTTGGFKFPDATTQTTAVTAIPSGMIAFFNLTACPSGWTAVSGAAGRVIVGRAANESIGSTVGTGLSSLEDRTHTHTGPSHTHAQNMSATAGHADTPASYVAADSDSGGVIRLDPNTGGAQGNRINTGVAAGGTGATGTAATSNVIPYIQYFVCSKN